MKALLIGQRNLNCLVYLPLFMADCQVLTPSMGRRQNTHGNTAQDMCTDELAYSLPLVTAVVHSHILKSSFLGAKCGDLKGKSSR